VQTAARLQGCISQSLATNTKTAHAVQESILGCIAVKHVTSRPLRHRCIVNESRSVLRHTTRDRCALSQRHEMQRNESSSSALAQRGAVSRLIARTPRFRASPDDTRPTTQLSDARTYDVISRHTTIHRASLLSLLLSVHSACL